MRKCITVLTVLLAMTIMANAQIPNSGFENWTTEGSFETPTGWNNCNSSATGSFYPVTKSTDHYPSSIGNYSIRVENKLPLSNCSTYGFAQTSDNNNPCQPSFPIEGHPTMFCGYYKCFPLNGDTIQIGLMLFKDGEFIAGAELITTNTVSDWTSFSIPISSYVEADSATIVIAAFYNDSTCGFPFGPYGNSVLYVDNLSVDELTTSISEHHSINPRFSVFPNPAYNSININVDTNTNDEMTFNMYSIVGNLVKNEALRNNEQKINISDLATGAYMVEVKTKGWSEKQKLIIQR
jgi:hypothetical protein